MSDVKYSKEHEWLKLDGDVATIGITKHATEMLGDIVFAELPEKGSNVDKDGTAGVCGIYTHHNPRSAPTMTGFNLGCVDEVNADDLKEIAFFDGKNHPMDQKK